MTDASTGAAASRDAALVALRPTVAAGDPDRAGSPVEAFLHRTLRPVLKLQNDAVLALVAAHVAGFIPDFSGFAPDSRRARLEALLRKDSRLKRTLVGVVYGALTSGELAFALAHEAEVRRRIVGLLAERVAGQSGAVAARIEAPSEQA